MNVPLARASTWRRPRSRAWPFGHLRTPRLLMPLLHNRGARPEKAVVSLVLVVCVLLGAVLIGDGARLARREALEHLSLSGRWSMMDRPSHRPSTLLLLGILAGLVSLRAILDEDGSRVSRPVASLAPAGPRLDPRDFAGSKPRSRAPPS